MIDEYKNWLLEAVPASKPASSIDNSIRDKINQFTGKDYVRKIRNRTKNPDLKKETDVNIFKKRMKAKLASLGMSGIKG